MNTWMINITGRRKYWGNPEYSDKPSAHYSYDSFVQNNKRVAKGDLVIVRQGEAIIGAGRIHSITSEEGIKTLHRCPVCGTSSVRKRKTMSPPFRCDNGHEFEEADKNERPAINHRAEYGDSFMALDDKIHWKELEPYFLNASTTSIRAIRHEELIGSDIPSLQPLRQTILSLTKPSGAMPENVAAGQGEHASELRPAPDDSDEDRAALIESIVGWFFENYEDPAMRTPYESKEGGYQWIWGGPYDASEVVGENFLDVPEDILEEAVAEIQSDGLYEWAPIPSEGDYDDSWEADDDESPSAIPENIPSIPEPHPGLSFALKKDGKIGLAPSGTASAADLDEIASIRETLSQTLGDLLDALKGSNAHTSVADAARQYQSVFRADPFSIDQLYAFGVRLENFRARLQVEIEKGGYPEMEPSVGAAFDSVLALHGLVIASTVRGKQLLDRQSVYAQGSVAEAQFKAEARNLAQAVLDAEELVVEDARQLIADINRDIGEGPHPERSTEVARTTNRNFLIRAAVVATGLAGTTIFGEAVIASVPGAALVELMKTAINASWTFFATNLPLLREYTAVAGPDMSWLTAFLNWLEKRQAHSSK